MQRTATRRRSVGPRASGEEAPSTPAAVATVGTPDAAGSEPPVGKPLAILDAAASVFMELGFAAASIDDISAAYGATKGLVYYHYRSKSALFFAVQRRAMELTREAIEPAARSAGRPEERLHAMAFAHTLLMMRHLPYLRVAGQGLELHLSGRTNAEERAELGVITRLRDGNEQRYTQVIADGVASKAFRNVDPRLAVKPLLGALNWTSRWYRPRPRETEADRERIAQEVATFAVHGLLGRAASNAQEGIG
jgi:AcrR family transcriptional regulator